MKYLVLLLIVLSSLGSFSQTQTSEHFSPHHAFDVCVSLSNVRFGSESGYPCNGGVIKTYYLFKPDENVQTDYINTPLWMHFGADNGGHGFPMSATYKLYGPFEPNDDYASLIANNGITPIASGEESRTMYSIDAFFEKGKHYIMEVTTPCATNIGVTFDLTNLPLKCKDCESCIPKFQPNSGQYIVTGWVKETGTGATAKNSYDKCHMLVITDSTPKEIPVSGQIVDGWQRMEKQIAASSTGNFAIELKADSGAECYFDDIRVIPFEASMVSYVYDPVTMRLVAELDERNYAKIYEYDEEGKLIRVKKETEKGIMTIQENRENSSSKENY